MRIKLTIFICCIFIACSESESIEPRNLAELITQNASLELDEVIACAASAKNDQSTSYIYYYPIPEAKNIQYFETSSVAIDPNDLSNYKKKTLISEDVFGGYLKRFVRTGLDEIYCIVTYETEGKFHKSNPIRLKNATKPTEYTNVVAIDFSELLMPSFTWEDGIIAENAIYFHVISDNDNNFISGTYTFEKNFQYYKLDNVVLDINRETPVDLQLNEVYNFSMLAVSLDNWVNLIIEKSFTAQ